MRLSKDRIKERHIKILRNVSDDYRVMSLNDGDFGDMGIGIYKKGFFWFLQRVAWIPFTLSEFRTYDEKYMKLYDSAINENGYEAVLCLKSEI